MDSTEVLLFLCALCPCISWLTAHIPRWVGGKTSFQSMCSEFITLSIMLCSIPTVRQETILYKMQITLLSLLFVFICSYWHNDFLVSNKNKNKPKKRLFALIKGQPRKDEGLKTSTCHKHCECHGGDKYKKNDVALLTSATITEKYLYWWHADLRTE